MVKHHEQVTCLQNKPEVIKSSAQARRIFAGELGNIKPEYLPVLCGRCHVFRYGQIRREKIIQSLKEGIRYPNWSVRLRKLNKANLNLFLE